MTELQAAAKRLKTVTSPEVDAAHAALVAKVAALKVEFPGISFGYIGNVGVDRSGPFDDRSWSVFLPHPGRVGTYEDRVGGFRTDRLDVMLAKWDSIEAQVRRGMKEGFRG